MIHAWHAESTREILATLSSSNEGLSEEAAQQRHTADGPNALPASRAPSAARFFLRQFANPLMVILCAAGVTTGLLDEWTDTTVIGIAIAVNVAIGFAQEFRADRALRALVTVIAEEATVLRAGVRRRIARAEVVRGDVVVVAAGDRIPADCRVLTERDCDVNEAILTGEAMPQRKTAATGKKDQRLGERKNMLYAGTVVTRGTATAVVIAIGAHTEIGAIAATLGSGHRDSTPLQRQLTTLSRWIAAVIVVLAGLVFGVGVASGRAAVEMFTIAVALAVAAIPEGLVVGVTAILAVGMHRLVRQHAVVRRLLAAETLGSTTVICTDKTGTLTEGVMRLTRVVAFDAEADCGTKECVLTPQLSTIIEHALAPSEAVVEERGGVLEAFGNPTERGIALGAATLGIRSDSHARRIDLLPFTSDRKMSAALTERGGAHVLSVVGAPDRLLPIATDIMTTTGTIRCTNELRETLLARVQQLGLQGGRVVGVAYRIMPAGTRVIHDGDLQRLTLGGFLVLEDPIRSGVPDMIAHAASAGVRTIVVTGDHRSTALHVARTIGLSANDDAVIDGETLAALSREQLEERMEKISVVARVVPAEKVRIVEALAARGAIVAMTGDGVNDAPALRAADIGIAVGTATDVAKEAADLVILDNNFGTIVKAIEQGRIIMDNIRKVTLYLLAGSVSEILVVAGALILQWPLPLLAKQILWINLVTDTFPNIALTLDPGEREVMRERPIPKRLSVLDRERWIIIGVISIATGAVNLGIFAAIWRWTGDVDHARTVTFTSIAMTTLLYVFSCRTMRRPIWRSNPFSNPHLVGAVALAAVLQLLALHLSPLQQLLGTEPLTMREWAMVLGASVIVLVLVEAVKFFFRRESYARPSA